MATSDDAHFKKWATRIGLHDFSEESRTLARTAYDSGLAFERGVGSGKITDEQAWGLWAQGRSIKRRPEETQHIAHAAFLLGVLTERIERQTTLAAGYIGEAPSTLKIYESTESQ